MKRLVLALVVLSPLVAVASEEESTAPCSELLQILDESKERLRECLMAGEPCGEEFLAREDAGARAMPCAPSATALSEGPSAGSLVAPPRRGNPPRVVRRFRLRGQGWSDRPTYFEVGVLAGGKRLSRAWTPVRSQQELGILLTGGSRNFPVQFGGDLLVSQARSGGNYGETLEIAFGARRNLPYGGFLPQVGAGACLLTASWHKSDGEGGERAAVGTNLGFWVGASGRIRVGKTGSAGIHARWTQGSVVMSRQKIAAGGIHLGLTIAIGSPPRS